MKFIYIILIIILPFLSCEEMVDLDLRTAEPMNVVDAQITEGEPCVVILTKSQAFKNNDFYMRISGAEIELRDGSGRTEILKEDYVRPGRYYSSDIIGMVDEKYSLKVTIEDDVYEASATIPQVVYIERVYIYAITAGDKSWYSPAITFYDPPGIENYYYMKLSINEKAINTIYLSDDEYRDGMVIDRILYFDKKENNDNDLEYGDYMEVEMQTLDKGMYTYYKSLFSVAEGANPLTNFTGGALGCFKAYNSSYGSATVSGDVVHFDK